MMAASRLLFFIINGVLDMLEIKISTLYPELVRCYIRSKRGKCTSWLKKSSLAAAEANFVLIVYLVEMIDNKLTRNAMQGRSDSG